MPLVLVGVGVLLTALVAYVVSQQSHTWADAIVRWCFGWLVFLPFVGKAVEPALEALTKWISAKFGNLYIGLTHQVVNWVTGLAHYVRFMGNIATEWPLDLVRVTRWLLVSEIPALVHALPNALTKPFREAVKWLRSLEARISRVVAHAPAQIRNLAKAVLLGILAPFLHPLHWLVRVWHKIEHAAAHAGGIAAPWIELPRLRKGERYLSKRVDKLWALLGVAGAVALVAKALGVSKSCVKSGNIGRAAKALCGLDKALMDLALLGTVEAFAVTDLCEFSYLMGEATKAIRPGLMELVSVEDALVDCHGTSKPIAFSLPPVSLPDVVGTSPLAA